MTARAQAVNRPAGAGPCAGTVTLAWDARYRRRGVIHTDGGEEVLLDLPEATELRDGDALVFEDGRQVVIRAAPEPLTEVQAEDPRHLVRLAWHVGNRHVPAQVEADRLLIRRDHVIEDMLARLGARITHIEAPFTPEGGAYGHGRARGHLHGHDPHHDPDAPLRDRHG
jgi:urease accessory protein